MRNQLLSPLTFALICLCPAHHAAAQFSAVAVSPKGDVIAAGGELQRIFLWDIKSAAVRHRFTTAGKVQGLAFIRDERTLAVGEDESGVEIWQSGLAGYAAIARLATNSLIYTVAASANGNVLAAGGHSGWTYLYETTTWKPKGVIFERSNLTCGSAFAPDGTFLATAGNTFSVWNTSPEFPLWQARGERSIPDIEAATKQSLRWFRVVNGEENVAPYCADIAVSPDGKRVAGVNGVTRHGTGGRNLYAWDAHTGTPLWLARATGMTSLAFIAGGSRIATGSDDGAVRIWESVSGKLLHLLPGHNPHAVRNIAVLPGDTQFVSAGEDGVVVLWDAQTGKRVREFRGRD